jgi:hypothetical protein
MNKHLHSYVSMMREGWGMGGFPRITILLHVAAIAYFGFCVTRVALPLF